MPSRSIQIAVLLVCLPLSTLHSATVWDEGPDGDLSTDANSPTALTFELGSNTITGSVVTAADTRDFLTFTIPAGRFLTALNILEYDDLNTPTASDGDRGYHALNPGTISFVPSGATQGNFFGGFHIDPPPGTDYLPIFAGGSNGGIGFATPLGAGDYSYVIQQTGAELTGYEVEFVVAVPEPSPMLYLGFVGGLTLAFRRWRTGRA